MLSRQRCCTVEHKTNLLPMLIRNAGPESPVERAQAVHKIRHLKDHLCQRAVLCIRTTAVARDTRNNAHTTGAILHQYHGTSAQFILQIALWCCAVLGLQLYSAMIHATVSSLLLDSGLSAPIHWGILFSNDRPRCTQLGTAMRKRHCRRAISRTRREI